MNNHCKTIENKADDQWILAKSETEAGLLMIRVNVAARKYSGDPRLSIRLGFAISFKRQTGTDLPEPDENEALWKVEDEIRRTVAEHANGLHVLTFTNARMKELVFYIQPGTDIASIHQALMESIISHEVQCKAVRDPDWEIYQQFAHSPI